MPNSVVNIDDEVNSVIEKGEENNLWPQDLNSYQKNQLAYLAVQYGLDPFFGELTVLGGKPFVTAAGLKRNAHDSNKPPISIQTELVDSDIDKRWWEYKSLLWKEDTPKGRPYIEFGEASPKDCTEKISGSDKDLKAMARTRAVSRVLRLAYNVNLTSAEEISGYDPETQEITDITPENEPEDTDESNANNERIITNSGNELTDREQVLKEIIAGDKQLKKELVDYLRYVKEEQELDKVTINDLKEKEYKELKGLLNKLKKMAS